MTEAIDTTTSACERYQRAASAWLRSGEMTRTKQLLSPLEELAGFNYGFVYLMEAGKGLVKIGFSEHPRRRLRELAGEHGDRFRLRACFVGEAAAERVAHRRFAHLRVENELFLDHAAIDAYFRQTRERVRSELNAIHVCTELCRQHVCRLDLRLLSVWLRR